MNAITLDKLFLMRLGYSHRRAIRVLIIVKLKI